MTERQSRIVAFVALLLGILFRGLWPEDFLLGRDQYYYELHINEDFASGHWPTVGYPSSSHVPIPFLSRWVMLSLRYFSPDILGMSRVLQVGTILGLLGFYLFGIFGIERSQRKYWDCGFAIFAVNPLVTLFCREWWPYASLHFLLFFCFLGFWNREKFWGSFLWGFVAMLCCQIQMAGFWFTFSLSVFVLWNCWRNRSWKKVQWPGWLVGHVLGALPLLYWVPQVMNAMAHSSSPAQAWGNILTPKFWSYWFLESWGLYLYTAVKPNFKQFLEWPTIAGIPTYLTLGLHLILLSIGSMRFIRWIRFKNKLSEFSFPEKFKESIFVCALMGAFMQLMAMNIHAHYLIYCFPFLGFWVSWLVMGSKRLWWATWVSQAAITALYLLYIHIQEGAPGSFSPFTNGRYMKASPEEKLLLK